MDPSTNTLSTSSASPVRAVVPADNLTQLIRQTVVPMLGEPQPLAEQVSQALLGQEVAVLGAEAGWKRIRTPDGYEGWVLEEALCPLPAGWGAPWVEVEDLWINLRAEPHSQRAAMFHAPVGSRLPAVDGEEKWVGVLLPDGRKAWTESHRVLEVEDAPLRPKTAAAICRTARRFLGVPYLWGGCSPAGIDCSGFVQLVMRLHGIQLERDAGPQSWQGVPSEVPAAAELVFFGPGEEPDEEGKDPERITHVGMMLNSHRFIHSRGSYYVCINSLNEKAWRSRLKRVRRFVQPR